MRKIVIVSLLMIAAAGLVTPAATAHPSAVSTESAAGVRCYLFNDEQGYVEYWQETNGVVEGGAPEGVGVANHFQHMLHGMMGHDHKFAGSGLQRAPTPGPDGLLGTEDDVPADTLLDELEYASLCF